MPHTRKTDARGRWRGAPSSRKLPAASSHLWQSGLRGSCLFPATGCLRTGDPDENNWSRRPGIHRTSETPVARARSCGRRLRKRYGSRCCATCPPSWWCSPHHPKFQPRWAHRQKSLRCSPESQGWHVQSSRSPRSGGSSQSAAQPGPVNTWALWCSSQNANLARPMRQYGAWQSHCRSNPNQKIRGRPDRSPPHGVCCGHARFWSQATTVWSPQTGVQYAPQMEGRSDAWDCSRNVLVS